QPLTRFSLPLFFPPAALFLSMTAILPLTNPLVLNLLCIDPVKEALYTVKGLLFIEGNQSEVCEFELRARQ
ncbi:MAG: hypothetical protein ACJ700_04175, partial [Nitrososphaera sp.]